MKIKNIVFYKYFKNGVEKRRACVFYNDGTVDNLSYSRGIDACERLMKENGITSKSDFKSLINNNLVHVMTKSELERRFSDFVSNSYEDNHMIMANKRTNNNKETNRRDNSRYVVPIRNNNNDKTSKNTRPIRVVLNNTNKEEKDTDKNNSNTTVVPPVPVFAKPTKKSNNTDSVEVEKDTNTNTSTDTNDSIENRDVKVVNNNSTDKEETVQVTKKNKKRKPFKRLVAFGTAAALLVGGIAYSITNRKSLAGKFKSLFNITEVAAQADEMETNAYSNLENESDIVFFGGQDETVSTEEAAPIVGSNDNYYNYTFEQLLAVTNNLFQKSAMTKLRDAIVGYNSRFASGHLEEGKDIRAALSFEEIVAIQNAYNDFSIDQIKAYFNGYELRSSDLESAYKTATLQLMGAHVIETRECPVDMSMLIDSEEGKVFYNKYHELFLAAKEATGDDKLAKINAFYSAVREDFPVTEEIRTEGISHSDSRSTIVPYKLSVTPMIAAAEMIFQNYEHDYTLDDTQIDFLNDIGLCNYAEETFDRIEQVTINAKICSGEDDTNPLYEQYRDSIITMLKERGEYVIDDAHRELSQLDAFQETVNWHFDAGEWVYVGGEYYTTRTYQQIETRTETETHEEVVETREEKEITDEARREVDEEIERENEEARRRAEEEAERERQRLQEEADREAERLEEEVRQDEEDLQQDIRDANEQIGENQDDDPTNDRPVNESDFGDHNVDFDDDFSDDSGNLDPSVENITTDGEGAREEADLPDPELTGARFDESVEDNSYSSNAQEGYEVPRDSEVHEEAPAQVVEYEEPAAAAAPVEVHEEAPAPVEVHEEAPAPVEVHEEAPATVEVHEEAPASPSNEQVVNDYVESQANEVFEYDESYDYSM